MVLYCEGMTYAELVSAAVPVSTDELESLLAQDDNPTIYPGPRKCRRIAMNAHMSRYGRHAFVGFDYCDRNGYDEVGTVNNLRKPLFVFERLGDRIVVWDNA